MRPQVISNGIKVGVIGVGSLGKEHARLYSEMAHSNLLEFTGIYDVASDVARRLAGKYQVRSFASMQEAAQANDALSVVTPTNTHHELVKKLLEAGKHVLVEKPMSDKVADAADLVQIAQQKKLVLQVGHV